MSAERTDLELLEAWRAGDNAAGKELFERHFDSIGLYQPDALPPSSTSIRLFG